MGQLLQLPRIFAQYSNSDNHIYIQPGYPHIHAEMPEWPNGTGLGPVGLVPSWVRILLSAAFFASLHSDKNLGKIHSSGVFASLNPTDSASNPTPHIISWVKGALSFLQTKTCRILYIVVPNSKSLKRGCRSGQTGTVQGRVAQCLRGFESYSPHQS